METLERLISFRDRELAEYKVSELAFAMLLLMHFYHYLEALLLFDALRTRRVYRNIVTDSVRWRSNRMDVFRCDFCI